MHGPRRIICILSLYYLQYTVSIDLFMLHIILYLPAHLDLLCVSQMASVVQSCACPMCLHLVPKSWCVLFVAIPSCEVNAATICLRWGHALFTVQGPGDCWVSQSRPRLVWGVLRWSWCVLIHRSWVPWLQLDWFEVIGSRSCWRREHAVGRKWCGQVRWDHAGDVYAFRACGEAVAFFAAVFRLFSAAFGILHKTEI